MLLQYFEFTGSIKYSRSLIGNIGNIGNIVYLVFNYFGLALGTKLAHGNFRGTRNYQARSDCVTVFITVGMAD